MAEARRVALTRRRPPRARRTGDAWPLVEGIEEWTIPAAIRVARYGTAWIWPNRVSRLCRLSLAASLTPQSLPALPAVPATHALLPLTSSPTLAIPGPASPLPSIQQPHATSPTSSRSLQPGPGSTQQAEPTPAFLVRLSNHTPFTPASQARHPPAVRPRPVPLCAARRNPPSTCHLPPDIVLYLCKPRNRIPDARRLLRARTVPRPCRHSPRTSQATPGRAGIPSSPSFRIRRHPLEPRTHPPGRTRETQLSTRPESAPQIRQSSRPGSPTPTKPPPQPLHHSPVRREPALGLSKEPALSLPKGNPLLAPRPQTPPKCTPPRLKSFFQKTLEAREAPLQRPTPAGSDSLT